MNAGFISFDGFVPGSVGLPGVNDFGINNFTGDPSLCGSTLPTDFAIFIFLTFQNAQLSLIEPSVNEVFDLGDVGPGTILSDLITAATDISSAKFTGILNQTALTFVGRKHLFRWNPSQQHTRPARLRAREAIR